MLECMLPLFKPDIIIREIFKMGPNFLRLFKTGQNKRYISKRALSFPKVFKNRTSGNLALHPATFSHFFSNFPKMPFGLLFQKNAITLTTSLASSLTKLMALKGQPLHPHS